MQFHKQWLLDPAQAPDDQKQIANVLVAFLESYDLDETAQAVVALGDLPATLVLIELLVERKDGPRLAWLRAKSPPKPMRKAIGKAIHRLKTIGVECDIDNPTVGVVGYTSSMLPSYMGTPLATGERILILSGRPDGYDVSCYAVIHESLGVEELVSIQDPSRTRIRRIIQSIQSDNTDDLAIDFIEADAGLICSRINAALEVHRAAGRPLPRDLADVQSVLAENNYTGPHPVHSILDANDTNLLAQGAALLGTMGEDHYRQGTADRPVLNEQWLKEFGQRIENARQSTVVIDEQQRHQRVVTELDHIVTTTFDPELRERSAERLYDTALILHHTGNTNHAAIAVATGMALCNHEIEATAIPWARQSIHQLMEIDFPPMVEPGHVHGPDCDHGHVHGPDCDHDHHNDTSLIIKP